MKEISASKRGAYCLVKRPFDTEAGVDHEAFAGEVTGELDLRADIKVGALEPSSDIVPELGFGDEHHGLLSAYLLSPDIEEAGEAESGCGTEIIASPDKSELKGHVVVDPVAFGQDVFIEEFQVEDVLEVLCVEAVVESDECGMMNTVTAERPTLSLEESETTVVLDLHAQVAGFGLLPEIEAACDLAVGHEGGVLGVHGVDVIIKIDEGEGVSPCVGIEEFEGCCDAVGSLVGERGSAGSEIVVNLQVRACLRSERKQTEQANYEGFIRFHDYLTIAPTAL